MKYYPILDHHNPEYAGLESHYNGMDYNDYLIEEALRALENEQNK